MKHSPAPWEQFGDEIYADDARHREALAAGMGVTVDDALPPIPRAAYKRRSQRSHGGYEMVPAYTVAELKAFAHEAIKRDRLERDGDLREVLRPNVQP